MKGRPVGRLFYFCPSRDAAAIAQPARTNVSFPSVLAFWLYLIPCRLNSGCDRRPRNGREGRLSEVCPDDEPNAGAALGFLAVSRRRLLLPARADLLGAGR